jgi:hypothetical protein
LLPPFSGWAFKILNTAPLTRLDLVEVELSYAPRISSLVFGALTIPTLEHLRIISCQFNFNDLAEFLSRHNTISTFEVTSRDVYQLPRTTIPDLVSLKSDLNNIDRLLTHTGAFPKLSHVCVVIHSSLHGQFMFVAVENSLARAAKRLTETNIRLCLDVLPASLNDYYVDLETLPNDLRNYPVLSRVREIAFGVPHLDVVTVATALIPAWLSAFPLLEHIELLNTPTGFHYEAKMSLLRRIAQKCVGIRTVKIGDDTREMSVWLSSDS